MIVIKNDIVFALAATNEHIRPVFARKHQSKPAYAPIARGRDQKFRLGPVRGMGRLVITSFIKWSHTNTNAIDLDPFARRHPADPAKLISPRGDSSEPESKAYLDSGRSSWNCINFDRIALLFATQWPRSEIINH